MATDLNTKDAPRLVYRVAHQLDLAANVDWHFQRGQSRWDDPNILRLRTLLEKTAASEEDARIEFDARAPRCEPALYRVLYCSGTEAGALIETLQPLRSKSTEHNLEFLRKYKNFEYDDSTFESEPARPGLVPTETISKLFIGSIEIVRARCADVENIDNITFLRKGLSDYADFFSLNDTDSLKDLDSMKKLLSDLDRGSMLSKNRKLTQLASMAIYRHRSHFAGITHYSCVGTPSQNWAFYEGRPLATTQNSRRVRLDDPILQEAASALDIQFEVASDLSNIVEGQQDSQNTESV